MIHFNLYLTAFKRKLLSLYLTFNTENFEKDSSELRVFCCVFSSVSVYVMYTENQLM